MIATTGSPGEFDDLPSIDRATEIADFETELVVLVPSTRRVHLLDPALSLVVHSCLSNHRRSTLVQEFAAATDRSVAATEEWLDEALESLARARIISDR